MVAILKWMFVLVLLIAVAGGGAAYWFYSQSDEGLRQLVLQQLQSTAPQMKFEIAKAQWDMMGRVRILGLTAFQPDEDQDHPFLEAREVIVTLESDQLTSFENVVIQRLYVVEPKIRLIRSIDNTWNLPQIQLPSPSGSPIADVEIEHGSVLAEFQLSDKRTRKLRFRNFNVSLHPSDAEHVSMQVATLLESAGPLALDVDFKTDGSNWTCSTHQPWKVPVDQSLIQLLCDLSPEVATQVASAGQMMDLAREARASVGARPSVSMQLESKLRDKTAVTDFGLTCHCGLNFFVRKPSANQPLEFKAQANIANGTMNNDLLPFTLQEMQGIVHVDNRQIILKNLRASNGSMAVAFDGEILPSKPITATMKFRGVELNNALRTRLPDALRRIVQSLDLTGVCDLDATIVREGDRWEPHVELRLVNGTVTHERFPVTVRGVNAKLSLESNVVDFEAVGKYAGQPVTARGSVSNPGPEHQADIVISSENLPLDDESIAACPAPIRASIEALRLKGRHNLLLRIRRPAGPNQKYEPDLNDRIYGGSLSFKDFPYAIQQLEGLVRWKGDLVEFNQLAGVHNGTRVTGQGTFRRGPGRGRLNLSIQANDAAFDRSLEGALPPALKQVWSQFQPQGNFDVTAQIGWVPGTPCVIRLPNVTVRDGEVDMKCFPWALHNLKGQFSYNTDPESEPGKLVINSVHAQHDDAQLSAMGVGYFPNRKPWRLEFEQLNVDNLIPNATFRNALPAPMQKLFDRLNPKGAFSFGGPVSFFGPKQPDQSVSATWNLKSVLSKCSISAGPLIEEIYGAVNLEGTWDGAQTTLDGSLDLDSIRLFRQQSGKAYQITKVVGPISYHNSRFVAGTEAAIPPRESNYPDTAKRLRGKIIGGTIFLDSAIDFTSEPDYKAFIEIQNGYLEQYAHLYMQQQSKLAGVMNGWVNLRGKGIGIEQMTGDGRMIIAPAALYELPLFVQLFQMPQMQSVDRSAFEQAELNFTVGDERVNFNSIELAGTALKLGGRGFVRFDGGMHLELGVTRKQLIPNPFKAVVGVSVAGNVGNPKINYVPSIDLDEGMRQFLGSFDMRKMNQRPNIMPPRSGKSVDEPLQ